MAKALNPDDLLELLRTQLTARQEKNSLYSATALAKQMGIVDSTLHKILRGERKMGRHLARSIAAYFGVEYDLQPTKRTTTQHIVSDLKFELGWLHLAILETLKLGDFQPSVNWISKRLSVPTDVVENAVAFMVDHGVLEIGDESWTDLLGDAAVAKRAFSTSEGLRAIQSEFLNQSAKALTDVDYSLREHSTVLVTLDPEQMPQFKKMLKNFRWQFATQAEKKSENKSELYALQVSLFPLSERNHSCEP